MGVDNSNVTTTNNLILLIDDQRLFLKSFSPILENYGYRVESCSEPMEALQLLKEKSYFVVLCDLYMESFSGYKLLYRFLQEKPQQTCCVITSAEDDDLALKKTLRLDNVKGVIKKPISYEKLDAVMQEIKSKI